VTLLWSFPLHSLLEIIKIFTSSRFQYSPKLGVTVEWSTLPGRHYDLLRSTTLDGDFLPVAENLPHTVNYYEETSTDASDFYRLRVRLEPE